MFKCFSIFKFDGIGRTNLYFGRLVAIMLGRLRMDIEECIKQYWILSIRIFRPYRMRFLRMYSRSAVQEAAKSVVQNHCHCHAQGLLGCDGQELLRQYDYEEAFGNGPHPQPLRNRTCKVYVHVKIVILKMVGITDQEGIACRAVLTVRESGATDFQTDSESDMPVLFRSYDHRERPPDDDDDDDEDNDREINPKTLHNSKLTIDQACSCTTAAPTYFRSMRVRGRRYIDGGVWANNPANVALNEARFMAKPNGERPKLLVSIGTGKHTAGSRMGLSGLTRFAFYRLTSTDEQEQQAHTNASPSFGRRRTIGRTETQNTAASSNSYRASAHYAWPQYFRFDVPQEARHKGLHKIGLATCKRKKAGSDHKEKSRRPRWPPQVQLERDGEAQLRREAADIDRESVNPGGFDPATYTYTTFDKIRDRTIAWLYADGNEGATQSKVTRCADLLWERSLIRRETNLERWKDFRRHPDPKHHPQPAEEPQELNEE